MEATSTCRREPWNKGKLVGQKTPFRLKEIWAIRVRLQLQGRVRDLALFNLGIDSKLRVCDPIRIPTPPGFCELGGHPVDEEMLAHSRKIMAGTNRVLTIFADCRELAEARRGQRQQFEAYGQVVVPAPGGVALTFKKSRRDYMEEVTRGMKNGAFRKGFDEAEASVKSRHPSAGLQENLGILDSDAYAAYVGVVLNGPAAGTTTRRLLGVTGLTVVKQVPISVNLYRSITSGTTVAGQLAEQQRNMLALVSANGS